MLILYYSELDRPHYWAANFFLELFIYSVMVGFFIYYTSIVIKKREDEVLANYKQRPISSIELMGSRV